MRERLMHAFMVRHQTPVLLIIILAAVAGVSEIGGLDNLQVPLIEMLIRVLVVVGLYVFIGNSGVISFGQIGFMCIGAYAAGWATAEPGFKQVMLQGLPDFLAQNQWPFPVAMVGAIVLPAIVALLFGLAILRLNGIAASIATFAFLIIVNSVYSNWNSVTAGVSSLVGIPTEVGPWVAFAFASAGIVSAYLFQISRYGLMLRATREDTVAAKACGVHSVRMRLIAFVLSAALVGAGGGLYAQFLGILTVDTFYLESVLHHDRHAGGGRHEQSHGSRQRRHRGYCHRPVATLRRARGESGLDPAQIAGQQQRTGVGVAARAYPDLPT